MKKKAVILISGGLDSTTTLAIAQSQGFECYALSFAYGQRHEIELAAAARVAKKFNVAAHEIIDLNIHRWKHSALIDATQIIPDYEQRDEIPTTYVPARNTIFLSYALSWAEALQAYDIFIGASSVDYSGYPDCRPEYMAAFEKLANLATKAGVEGQHFHVHAPLMKLSKAETIQKGLSLGVDYSTTISCYQCDDQGRACGRCDSCHFRKRGFEQAGVADPTVYVG